MSRSLDWFALLVLTLMFPACKQEVPEKKADSPEQTEQEAKPQQQTEKNTEADGPKLLLSPEQIQTGWVQLFDGESLFGWKANSEMNWRVEEGVITADEGDPGLLLTTVPFANYELLCDFKLEAGGNSGIFLRTVPRPTSPAKDCYELNICDTHEAFKTGSLVARAKPSAETATDGEWNTFHVTVNGPNVKVKLNEKDVLDFSDETDTPLTSGLIGLQMNGGKIEFKNVFLRPLGSKPIFNGEDLTGWREVPGSKSEFLVGFNEATQEKDNGEAELLARETWIQVSDGPGFLETEKTYGDFILQADVQTNAKELNSGIFFRAMPGTEDAPSNGYEFQIHNGYKDNDRTQPEDQGTGAIFRRAPARVVVSNDNEWTTITLLAVGPRFATWVNGYPVVNWRDSRKVNENPRLGRRVEPGHISLQGHDPTTNAEFKELRVSEYPASD